MNIFSIFSLFFIVVGVAGLIGEIKKQENCFYRQIATFVDYVEKSEIDEDGFVRVTYYPVFTYSFNNDDYTEQLDFGSSDRPYQKGDEVEIEINPEMPTQYVLTNKKSSNKIFFILFILLGMVVFVVSFLR